MSREMQQHPSSYRDPAGFLFTYHNHLYRQVNESFQQDFDAFINTGLYQLLTEKKLLIPHTDADLKITSDKAYKFIKPEWVPFISYPSEWCFDMWKDAALTTLAAVKHALTHGLVLRDAPAYNAQLHKGNMLLIDTLSFGRYDAQKPWIAYRQFCEHFMAPLALMHFLKMPVQSMFSAYPNGIPLDVAKTILPFRSRFHLHTYLHIHLHAGFRNKKNNSSRTAVFSRTKMEHMLNSLESAIQYYHYSDKSGAWSGYYEEAQTREEYLTEKQHIISNWVDRLDCKTAVDLGANEGAFSMITAGKNIYTISADADHYSVNQLYKKVKQSHIKNIHPIVLDLRNPTAALGVNNNEWSSFSDRAHTDLVLALALIHHLAVACNIPFEKIKTLFKSTGHWLIVEFVPKDDVKTQMLLADKPDIYDWYTEEHFKNVFSEDYHIEDHQLVGSSGRTLYLMKPKYMS